MYEFPKADWDDWLETSAAVVEADVDAFRAAWQATGDVPHRELSGGMPPVRIRDPEEQAEMLRAEAEASGGESIDDLRRIHDLLGR